MLLQDAISMLQDGKCMCREAWKQEEGYIKLMLGMTHIWKIVLHPAPNAGNYIFSLADLIADDWKEFELPKDAIEVEQTA